MANPGDSRRYHEANSGRDSKPVIFIFEGNNILWMLLGCGLALLVFRLGHGQFNYSLGESLALALIPLSAITLYVVLLKSGQAEELRPRVLRVGRGQVEASVRPTRPDARPPLLRTAAQPPEAACPTLTDRPRRRWENALMATWSTT